MVRAAALGLTLIIFAIGSGPAEAARLEGECIWDQVRPEVRDRLAVAYADGGMERFNQVNLDIPIEDAMACADVPDDEAEARALGFKMGRMGVAISQEVISREYLGERGYSQSKLDAAWQGLGARDRASLRTIAQLNDLGTTNFDDSERAADIIIRGSQLAGRPFKDLEKDPALTRFIDYFMARAAREVYEAAK